jgi:hypothetical protein
VLGVDVPGMAELITDLLITDYSAFGRIQRPWLVTIL